MTDTNTSMNANEGVSLQTAVKTAQMTEEQLKAELDKHFGSITTATGIKLIPLNFGFECADDKQSPELKTQSEMTDEEFEAVQDWIDPDIAQQEGELLLSAATEAVTEWAIAQADADNTHEVSEKKSKTLLRGYPVFLWAKDSPETFENMMELNELKVRSHATFGMKVFRFIEHCSGAEVHRGTLSKFGAISEYSYDRGKTADDFEIFLDEESGWTTVYELAKKEQDEKDKKRRNAQTVENNSWLQTVKEHAAAIAIAPIEDERKKGVKEHFGGFEDNLVLMVGRLTTKSIHIIGRLEADEKKAKSIIITNGIHEYDKPALTELEGM